jgi:purine-cytosine permease-like protein
MHNHDHHDLIPNDLSSGEFERSPVPANSRRGFANFLGWFTGEHCSGRELMIGPLFVAAGVGAFDLLVGLLVGNLLAVLSWTLMTAPIATKVRLTLYYHLERICGRHLVTLYNLANGVMFCLLAGSMITITASAVGAGFSLPMPRLIDFYPAGVPWIATVTILGILISIAAAGGYRAVAKIANIASPFLVLMFLVFGFVGLTKFAAITNTDLTSPTELWALASNRIWTGDAPLPGRVKFTFLHVVCFAWFANMALHIGMNDLTVLRYARRTWHGLASGAGVFVGHYLLWISAGILFSLQLQTSHPDEYLVGLLFDNSETFAETSREEIAALPLSTDLIREGMEIENAMIKAGELYPNQKHVAPPAPLPGLIAKNACGIMGVICVIIAGWTAANPLIYRAGLAFHAITPRSSRFVITIISGLLSTAVAMYPGLSMRLLEIIAVYGLVLMPMGAIIFVDFWLFPRIGLKRFYAETAHISFNISAALTWVLTGTVCWFLVCATWLMNNLIRTGQMSFSPQTQELIRDYITIEIYFVAIPGWFFAAFLYTIFSLIFQHRDRTEKRLSAPIVDVPS